MLNELSPWHLIIVLVLFALLFGSKRLPDAARGLGRSLRIFKAEMRSAKDEFTAEATAAPVAEPAPPVQDAVPPATAFTTQPAAEPVIDR